MAIVFADEARRRRRRRLAGKVAVGLALLAGGFAAGTLLAGSEEDSSDVAQPPQVQRLAAANREFEDPTQHAAAAQAARDLPPSPNAPGPIDCQVTDGDTLNCAGRRIRLIGIDAPELPGHCRDGRDCVEGDPFAASSALQSLIADADLQIVVTGRDSYDRELANVYANGRNVACDLIAGGSAIYVAKWDDNGTVKEDCALSGL